jgi:TRAP-type C4-dicarboxylate transport system substrate-binding protein
MTFTKTTLVISAAITVAAFTVGMSIPTTPAGAKELKIATFMSPKHHLNSVVFTNLAKAVGEATGGSTTMKLFSGGQLGKGPTQQYKRLVDNVAEVVFGIQGDNVTIFPRTMVVGQPGVGTTAVGITKKIWSVYDKYLAGEYKRIKVLGLWANTPPVLVSKKPIRRLSDLKGKKVRAMSATNIPQVNQWGAAGLSTRITAVYDALDKGVLDVVQVAVNAVYNPWRFGEIAKHITDGLLAPSAMFYLGMNSQVWDGLSAADKAKIDGLTGRGFSLATAGSWAKADVKAIASAKKGVGGVTYYMLSKSDAAPFDAATTKSVEIFLAAQEKNGVPARAIYAAVTKPGS